MGATELPADEQATRTFVDAVEAARVDRTNRWVSGHEPWAGRWVNFGLVATWSSDSAESYPVFDSSSQTLVDHREALWLSWFASAGAFDDSVTGRQESDTAVSTGNAWQSPATADVVFLWLVLHDSRGGADFASYTLTVVP